MKCDIPRYERLEYVRCNLCDSDDSTILFTGKDRRHKKPGLFSVVRCKNVDCYILIQDQIKN